MWEFFEVAEHSLHALNTGSVSDAIEHALGLWYANTVLIKRYLYFIETYHKVDFFLKMTDLVLRL